MAQLDKLKVKTLLKVAHIQRDHLIQITGTTQQEGLFAVDYYSSNDRDTWTATKMHMNIIIMPHTIISKRELALELIAKYYHNPDKCSVNEEGNCSYYDKKTGNMCIMGMCMKNPQSLIEDMNALSIGAANRPEFRDIVRLHPIITSIFQLEELRMLQSAHDIIANRKQSTMLDTMFKAFTHLVEPSMYLNVKSIERHIADCLSLIHI
jgi:hypothetical protein